MLIVIPRYKLETKSSWSEGHTNRQNQSYMKLSVIGLEKWMGLGVDRNRNGISLVAKQAGITDTKEKHLQGTAFWALY